jgi:signal transduction histidine kinase
MWAIASFLRRFWPELAWALFATANVVVMFALTDWETIPFHFVWVSLTLLYGFRLWSVRVTAAILATVMIVTGTALYSVTHSPGGPGLDEMAEVPLMAAMFVAAVWHAIHRQTAMEEVRRLADSEHRLRERERAFVRDASHELRTPITVARGHAELIRNSNQGTLLGADVDVILDELKRLSTISERMLILAAAEHPDFIRVAPVRINELIEESVRRWRPAARREWIVSVEADCVALADRDRLATALDALIENAVAFTHDGARVGISSLLEGSEAVVEVSDTGIGIPDSHTDIIFDRFARAPATMDRATGGTGLGLAIVRAIMKAHGGSVDVSSREGIGSVFRLRLPAVAAGGRRPPSPSALRSGVPSTAQRPEGAEGPAGHSGMTARSG